MTPERWTATERLLKVIEAGHAETEAEYYLAQEVRACQQEMADLRAALEGEASAMDELAQDMGLPGRNTALRLCARSIRSALAGGVTS